MTAEPGWERALDRAARSRLTLLVGDVDAGKTSLATFLGNGLLARGFRVGVVDADLGQSEVGPPTTIGLGRVTRRLSRLGDADVAGLSFVGSTSPAGHVGSTLEGTQRMADRAAALGFERVVVDTSGLVGGELGRILKQRKIELLNPDLVICLERGEECESILRPYAGQNRPEILRLPVGVEARRRSAEERRRHRAAALAAYFHGSAYLRLPRSGLGLRLTSDRPDPASLGERDDLEGALVGLDDASGDTLGVGVIRALDAAELLVETPLRDVQVAGLRLGARRTEACVT
jgi:polynucleotide 5'-hydroxyl-kinase GRC3/NOL9